MTTTVKMKKPQYNTLAVTKDDGSVVQVKRTTLDNLQTLIELQDKLIEAFITYEASMGEILLDEEARSSLEAICGLLPVVGKDNEYLEFKDIQENWEQLIVLFFHGGYDTERRELGTVKPSKVSDLHFLRYGEMLVKHLQIAKEREAKEKD